MSHMVKNVKSSSRFPKPSTGECSWLKYWNNHTHSKATKCGACGNKSDIVGGHVINILASRNHWFITPLCKSCNAKTKPFWVETELVPVPSNL